METITKETTLNERQREELSTCLDSCRNLAYPSLGLVEEVGEYIQKLLCLIDWNKDFAKERPHLEMLLRGIATNAYAIGRYAKQMRHTGIVPFSLKSDDLDENPFFLDRLEAIQKELGDVHWMTDAAHFYTNFIDGTNPTDPDIQMTAQQMADQNYRKLAERRAMNTIDGQGDTNRSSVE